MIDETLTPETFEDLATVEELAVALERHSDYRVLRRFVPDRARVYNLFEGSGVALKTAVYLDFEATGLDPLTDKPIALAMARFTYDVRTGLVGAVTDTYEALEHPGRPIPSEITELTGISDADVMHQAFDDDEVAEVLGGADLVVAHHADYDRRMFEQRFPAAVLRPWACSHRDIDWKRHGVRNAQLATLLYETRREFADEHRALADVLAGVHVLAAYAATAPFAGVPPTYLGELLASAREATIRLLAWGWPFARKDELKARGYSWNGPKKVWYRDMALGSPAAIDEEVWLGKVCRGASSISFSALDRYSIRV